MDNNIYYTSKEISEKFNVTTETIRNWRVNKGLKAHKISQRKYIFNEKDIEFFLKGQ
jgi:excisionase family DNA binding protein